MNNQSFKSLKKHKISKIFNNFQISKISRNFQISKIFRNFQISKISRNLQISKAFTIVELIIAILIFGTGLLVILTVLNKNLIFAKKVEFKTQATFLAKEGMELVYNLRDSNVIKYKPWNYLSGQLTKDTIKNNTYEKFEIGKKYIPYYTITGYKVKLAQIFNVKNARLYKIYINYKNRVGDNIYSGFFYNYFTGEKTPFYRYVAFSGVYLKPEGTIVDKNKILILTSKVFYTLGNLTGEAVFSSFIGNWR